MPGTWNATAIAVVVAPMGASSVTMSLPAPRPLSVVVW